MRSLVYSIALIFCFVVCGPGISNAQWVETYGPYGGTVLSLAVSGTNLFAGTNGQGVFLSTDDGTSWWTINSGLPPQAIVNTLAINGMNIFAGIQDGGVFLSTDNGTSWTADSVGIGYLDIYALAVSGTNLFAGTDLYNAGIFLSADTGKSWTWASPRLTYPVSALAVNGTNLFAGTSGNGVFLSADNGTSWAAANAGIANLDIDALAISGTNLFAGNASTYGGLFRSTNNGTSWTSISAGLTNPYVHALAVSGTNLFAGIYNNVFLSTDNGASWTTANSGLLPQTTVLAFVVKGTNLFAGTYGAGVWRRPLSEMPESGVYEGQPSAQTIAVYPNPFSTTVTLQYVLDADSRVSMVIYNALGRIVATPIISHSEEAGVHEVEFDAKNLPAGIYWCRVSAGGVEQSAKLVLK
jgi:hypothetical protein